MKVRNKIGFHCGPGGNATGIGEWMRRLDRAGIPFFLKSVDGYGPLFEAAGIARQSGIDHTLVFRLSTVGQGHEYDYDVPPYKDPRFVDDPEGAAIKHWRKTLSKLPPEFDKELTWIEPVNEVDKNLCDWLGRFAVKIADLAQNGGYKVTLFAWSSGEPEPEGWETEGMLNYLRLCAQRPRQAAIALHEYSYIVDNIKDEFPYKIGRFQKLFEICDKHRIPWPTVHITEWGWTLNNVPSPQNAIADIQEIGELYARYPQISGAAIWYLGPGFGGIANKAQRLIKPTLDFTLLNQFDVELAQPAANLPLEPDEDAVDDDSEMDSNPLPPAVDDSGAGLDSTTSAEDGPISLDPEDEADGEPDVVEEPQMDDAHIEPELPPSPPLDSVEEPAGKGEGAYDLQFVADVTIPDDSRLKCRSSFVKTWRVRNMGTIPWDDQVRLQHTDGVPLGAASPQPCPPAAPGEEVQITIQFTVPNEPGVYYSDWHLQDGAGNNIGEVLFTRILADDSGRSDGVYVADVTIPDDSRMQGGLSFTKTWRVRNTGARVWGGGYTLRFEKGAQMGAPESIPLPPIEPGAEGDVSVPQTAPLQPGTHFGDWRLTDDGGRPFGEILFLRIVVR